MKRILAVMALFGAATFLMATKDPNHKIDWCHFPPGQYPDKVLILSIDVAADGTIGPAHQNHKGDGPVCIGPDLENPHHDCIPLNIPYHGPAALGANCGGTPPPTCPTLSDPEAGIVQLVFGTGTLAGQCVCPPGTAHAGQLPVPDLPLHPGFSTCQQPGTGD